MLDGVGEYFRIDSPLLADHGNRNGISAKDASSLNSADAVPSESSLSRTRAFLETKKAEAYSLIYDTVGLIKRGLPLELDAADLHQEHELDNSAALRLVARARDSGHFIIPIVLAKYRAQRAAQAHHPTNRASIAVLG